MVCHDAAVFSSLVLCAAHDNAGCAFGALGSYAVDRRSLLCHWIQQRCWQVSSSACPLTNVIAMLVIRNYLHAVTADVHQALYHCLADTSCWTAQAADLAVTPIVHVPLCFACISTAQDDKELALKA